MLKVRTVLISLTIALVGCSATGAYIKPDALAASKSFAMISDTAYPVVMGDGGVMGATDFDLITSFTNDRGFTNDATEVFKYAHANLLAMFKQKSPFPIKDESEIITNKAYKASSPDENKGFLVAEGYQYVTTPEKAAAMAKALGVDTVIVVTFRFGMEQGSSIGIGAAAVTKRLGATYIKLTAYDQNGVAVWKDFVYEISKNGYTEPGTSSFSLKKLTPYLYESTDRALASLFNRINAKLKK